MVFWYYLRIEITLLSIFNKVCVVWGSVISGGITHWAYLCMVLIKVRERLRTRYPSIKITNRKEISYWITLHSMQALSCLRDWKENTWYVCVTCNATRHKGGITSGSLSKLGTHTFWCQVTAWVGGWLPVSGLGKFVWSWTLTPEFLRDEQEWWFEWGWTLPKKTCPWQGETFSAWTKTIQSCGIYFQNCWMIFLFILHTLCVRQVSGQDVVQTPTQLHPRLNLMPLQLSHLQNT